MLHPPQIGGFVVAVCTAVLVTPLVRQLAIRRGWVDAPDGGRKMHKAPVPHVGGLALVLAVGAGLAYAGAVAGVEALPSASLCLGALFMFLVGFYDDIFHLGFRSKFALQILVAYWMVYSGYTIDVSHLPFVADDPRAQLLLSIPLTMFWIVGVVNAINLLDGLDGLAAGIVAIAFASLAAAFGLLGHTELLLLALAVVGAIAGFLVYNFNPASIFMGDSGSMLLGFLLAVFAIEGTTATATPLALAVPILAIGLPLTDTSVTILRRVLAGRSPFYPDGDHIHHRMLRTAGSTRRAVLLLYGIGGCFGVAAVAMAKAEFGRGMGILLVVALLAYGLLRRLGYPRVRATLEYLGRRYASRHELRQARLLETEPIVSSSTESGDGARRESTGEPTLI